MRWSLWKVAEGAGRYSVIGPAPTFCSASLHTVRKLGNFVVRSALCAFAGVRSSMPIHHAGTLGTLVDPIGRQAGPFGCRPPSADARHRTVWASCTSQEATPARRRSPSRLPSILVV
jgi:hypothetical protein